MQLNWFESLIYGLVCGFTEFLPVSSEAHGILFSRLVGVMDAGYAMRLAVHIGMLIALMMLYGAQISRLNRERRIAAVPYRRRKRQPDGASILELSLLKIAAVPLVLGFVAYPWVGSQGNRLWILGLALVLNGFILYFPQFVPGANKDIRTMSRLDAFLMGLGGAVAVFPGISRMGATLSTAHVRGVERQHGLQTAMLLSAVSLVVYIAIDIVYLFATRFAGFSFFTVIYMILACGASAFSAYFGILLMRFLSVRIGYAGFAFYNWGAALFAFIIYLLT